MNLLLLSLIFVLNLSITPLLFSAETPYSEKSADPEDQFRLGKAYEMGEGVTQSYEKAGFWYRKSAEQGNIKAMHNLGILYINGRGCEVNLGEAYRWIKKAAESGSPRSYALCGMMKAEGMGSKKDAQEALYWLEKGVKADDPRSMFLLGKMLATGDPSVTSDIPRARTLLETAANRGDADSCLLLFSLIKPGGKVSNPDPVLAKEWLKKGGLLGNSECLFQYGSQILVTNPVTAYPWVKNSADLGNPAAVGLLTELHSSLTASELQWGEEEARAMRGRFRTPVH